MAELTYKVLPKGEPVSANETFYYAGQTYKGDSERNQRLVQLGYVEVVQTSQPTPQVVAQPIVAAPTPTPTTAQPVTTTTASTTSVETEEASRRRGRA